MLSPHRETDTQPDETSVYQDSEHAPIPDTIDGIADMLVDCASHFPPPEYSGNGKISRRAVVTHTQQFTIITEDYFRAVETYMLMMHYGRAPEPSDTALSVTGVPLYDWYHAHQQQGQGSFIYTLLSQVHNMEHDWGGVTDDMMMVAVLHYVGRHYHLPSQENPGLLPTGETLYDFIHGDHHYSGWIHDWLTAYGVYQKTPILSSTLQVYEFCDAYDRFPTVRDTEMLFDGTDTLSHWAMTVLNGYKDDEPGGARASQRLLECATLMK